MHLLWEHRHHRLDAPVRGGEPLVLDALGKHLVNVRHVAFVSHR